MLSYRHSNTLGESGDKENRRQRVQTWDTRSLEVQPHQPQVLHSDDEGRTVVINLPAGEELQDHQVHERAWILVVDGTVEIDDADGATFVAGPGGLALTAPNERHEVRAREDSRILLVLAPWPGEGHPRNQHGQR
jgi:quercetin dioxygenase-like cupin family protein